jgi:hypothetical protein
MLSSYAMRFKFGFRNAKPPAAKWNTPSIG